MNLRYLTGPRRVAVALILAAAALLGLTGTAHAGQPADSLQLHGQRITASVTSRYYSSSTGYSPQQIRSAYSLPATGAPNQKVAIISAYNDPTVAGDLAAYSRFFHLPACTVASGCLRVYNQEGKASPLPQTDPTGGTWRTESSLGTQTVHGVCESCKIMLFEADAPVTDDLSAAANAAAEAGATVVVTTFEPVEGSTDTDYALDFSHARTTVVSATGEALNQTYGYSGDINFPASLPNVLAVGGTDLSLSRSGGGYGQELAWSDSVSGCSLFSLTAPWQLKDSESVGCGHMRAVADLAADANPGVIIYASGLSAAGGPFYQATGTSVAAPIIAAEIGLAGSLGSSEAQMVYAHASSDRFAFHHIYRGKTSATCTSKICEAGPGFNGPTGLGTPDGLAAFLKTGGELPAGTPNVRLTANHSTVSGSWKFSPTLKNNLAIELFGVERAYARVGGHNLYLGAVRFRVSPEGTFTPVLTVAPGARSSVAGLRALVALSLRVNGVGGRAATVVRDLAVSFPR